jgi:ribose 5-phosphate isomerase B
MKNLITEEKIIRLSREGKKVLPLGNDDILTPLAKDALTKYGIKITTKKEAEEVESKNLLNDSPAKTNKVVIASDHTGFKAKQVLSQVLSNKNLEVVDVGTYSEESCDYPDFAYAAAKNVAMKKMDFGIIIDATGIPSAITANKVPGIRAATCYNEFTAKSAREHNNANILVLGAKALGEETLKSILETWLKTSFGGGRHQKRLSKIHSIEEKFIKKEFKLEDN